MAYIDCDKCSHGSVCAYRHQYDDHIVTCSHWQPVDEERKFTNQKIVSELDGADVFLRGRATSKSAPLNEYDIEVLLGIANICAEAADTINHQKTEIERLTAMVEAVEDYLHPLPFKNAFDEKIDKAKADAIKEFAERLKETKFKHVNDYIIYADNIDNLVKEMTEDKP